MARVEVVALGLSMAATTLGLSRFGYGVLLPAMRADLGWSFAEAGLLDTANAVGYLAGALASPALLRRFDAAAVLRACAVTVCLCLLGSAVLDALGPLMLLRGIAGAAGSALFVVGGLLAARLAASTSRSGVVLGIYYAGVGPGILLTATMAPLVLADVGRWPLGWLALGVLVGGCAMVAGRSAARVPAAPVAAPATETRSAPLGWVLTAFVLFGIGYVPFSTFAVQLWHQTDPSPGFAPALWALVAVSATASGWVWRGLLTRPDVALVVLLALVAAAVVLPIWSATVPALAASALLFGLGFLSVTAAVTGLIQRYRPADQWSRLLAGFIAAFGAGQVIGPVLTGLLADRIGLRAGLVGPAVLLIGAVLAALVQLRQARRVSRPG